MSSCRSANDPAIRGARLGVAIERLVRSWRSGSAWVDRVYWPSTATSCCR